MLGLRSSPSRVLLACAILGGLTLYGGCSYVFVTTPKEGPYGVPYAGDCTTNVAAPVIDSLLVGTNVISTLYVSGEENVSNKGQAVGVGLLATGFWLSSAIYGYYNTSKCAALRSDGDPGPYGRPVRSRRTVLSGAPLRPYPPAYPESGAGGAGGSAAPPPAAAVPAIPQQIDEDQPAQGRPPPAPAAPTQDGAGKS